MDPPREGGGGPEMEQVCPSENRRLNSDSERNDVRSVGADMMELMESMTYILDAQSRKLKNADEWKDGLGRENFHYGRSYRWSVNRRCCN